MHIAKLAVATLFLLPGAALAQGNQNFDDLDADRINADQVMIEFEYTGGVCETVGPAELGDVTDGNLALTFSVTATAEVCTMQAKEIEVEQAVAADVSVTHVTVTLLGADGATIASESERIDD
jgi:hypothetical protein